MGNICRSPTAKGFFDQELNRRGLSGRYQSESAGTHSWHQGEPPDRRSIAAARHWGVDISGDRSRPLTQRDYYEFDYLVAMDGDNERHIRHQQPADSQAQVFRLLTLNAVSALADVPDPYYGGEDGFQNVCELLDAASRSLVDWLEAQQR